jgi:hypothetical protein
MGSGERANDAKLETAFTQSRNGRSLLDSCPQQHAAVEPGGYLLRPWEVGAHF